MSVLSWGRLARRGARTPRRFFIDLTMPVVVILARSPFSPFTSDMTPGTATHTPPCAAVVVSRWISYQFIAVYLPFSYFYGVE